MSLHVAGLDGNELYCLALRGLTPGELVIGNSVRSLGISGALASFGRTVAGGEIRAVTDLISEGRHAAIARMEAEAKRLGATGVTGVTTELKTLAGFTEFFSQGTSVFGGEHASPFTTAASGIETYCHLEAGYEPLRFVMGNVAYALGVGRGLAATFRTLARGEVRELAEMYDGIRHLALDRLRREASLAGANAVVDVQIRMLPHGPGTVELLLTGTASRHVLHGSLPAKPADVVTSELSGTELVSLAMLDHVPAGLVMATTVLSLGVVSSFGALVRGISRGELPEVTKLVYDAREKCLDRIRAEAERVGADRVVGNRLVMRELGSGIVEVVATGTAVKRAAGARPAITALPPQAIATTKDTAAAAASVQGLGVHISPMDTARQARAHTAVLGVLAPLVVGFFFFLLVVLPKIIRVLAGTP